MLMVSIEIYWNMMEILASLQPISKQHIFSKTINILLIIRLNQYTFGKTENFIAKADLGYTLFKSTQINGILDYNRTKGFGSGFGIIHEKLVLLHYW